MRCARTFYLMLLEQVQQWGLLICSKRPSTKSRFSGLDISDSFDVNKGSCVLYSPWASGHLYTHRKNWITVSILQYRVTFWTPEIVPRLNTFSKSIGSFCIRCGLGCVLGGYAGTISSWAFPEKTTKNTEKRWFLCIKTQIVGPATSWLSVHGRYLKFLWYVLKNLN